MLLKTYSLFAFIMLVISPAIRAGEPVHDWSRRFGDVDNQNAHGAAVDVLGNSIVTGYFAGTVDFGGDALTSAGGTDIFVARFYPDGTHRGSRRFGDGGDQYAYSAAVDDVGYVIVTGYFADTVDFGGDTLTSAGGTDIFVARFNPLGVSHDWSKRFGDSADQRGMGVTIDGSRNVFVTGYFKGTVDFGGGPLTSAGSWDIFVAKFDFGGTHLWSRRFGDTYDQYAYEPAVDNSGNVIVTGYFTGTVDFGGGALVASIYDIFIAKYDPSGAHLWSKHFGDDGYQVAYCAAVDALGNIIVTGSSQGTVDFGGGPLTSAGAYDTYVAKFDPDGTHLWSQRFGDVADDYAYSAAVDDSGNVTVAGRYQGTVDFGGGPLTSAGGYDIFVAKFDPDGTHLWSQGYGDAADQIASSAAADTSGNVIVTGSFQGTVDFGGGELTSEGSNDIFVVRFLSKPDLLLWTDVTLPPVGDTSESTGLAWGDYDNDGDLDLYVANVGGWANKLFRNEGGGVFTDATCGPLGDIGWSRGVAWGDYDNDGDLDLYVANASPPSSANKLFRNEGGGVFTDVTNGPLGDTGGGSGVAWGDYDNDGDLDLYLANVGAGNKLFRNEGGGGAFTDATSAPLDDSGPGRGVAWGDYDNDGDLDLYLANYASANKLFRNEGGGVFTDATSGPLGDTGSGTGVAWGDYDNDGDLDLYLATSPANKLFRNEGGGIFTDATSGPLGDTSQSAGVAWGDYDNDGDLDLYVVNFAQANKLFRNEGGGVFIHATSSTLANTLGGGLGVACGDYDNDGDLDLYVANAATTSANKLFRNDLPAGNHWLHVDLAGVISNRCGIGARVRVVAGGVSQIREVSGGSGYLSQNSLTAEFGLGSASTVDMIEVLWPSGTSDDSVNVAVDQRIIVLEGWGIVTAIDESTTPMRFVLYQNVPNPFNPTTVIRYDTPEGGGHVSLRVYDVQGKLVRTLVNDTQSAGAKQAVWDAKDDHGNSVASGVYFYRMTAPGFVETRKMVLLR